MIKVKKIGITSKYKYSLIFLAIHNRDLFHLSNITLQDTEKLI